MFYDPLGFDEGSRRNSFAPIDMVRKQKPKLEDRGAYDPVVMLLAVKEVQSGGTSYRAVAKKYNLKFQTLYKRCNENKENKDPQVENMKKGFATRRIFTQQQEDKIGSYITLLARIGVGNTPLEVRALAYQVALKNNISIPQSWHVQEKAGLEWFRSFLQRQGNLSLRKPEGCSVARASAFNKENMMKFFDRLEEVLNRHPHFRSGFRVFNLDECGTTTVGCVGKIVAPKGQKQVYQSTSGERGTLVTTCLIVGAMGQVIPPVMVFPRKVFKNHMLTGAYPLTLGVAAESGWMNADLYVEVLRHFVKYTSSSQDNPTLLLCDNCESHLSIEALDFAVENGVTILTLVPHTTHRTQPLDVSVMCPFKNAYKRAMASWKRAHVNANCTIYELAAFVNAGITEALTPSNIMAGFKKTGIMPFDREVFSDLDYLPSMVTHRPPPATTENAALRDQSAQKEISFTGPEDIFGVPAPPPRKQGRQPRRKGKSMVATDQEELEEIRVRKLEREAKKRKPNNDNDKQAPVNKRKKISGGKNKKTYDLPEESDEESVDNPEYSPVNTSDGEMCKGDEGHEDNTAVIETGSFPPLSLPILEEQYVLVEFKPSSKTKGHEYYIAKVLRGSGRKAAHIEVSYLRRSLGVRSKFCLPDVPDLASVNLTDVKMVLAKPSTNGTRRQQNLLQFSEDFSQIKVN
ncbi:hypothetical protein FOCC_FOCC015298 [Frankliniella occidentalis]|nr:hypothetical protein FOCC_FOCC015298 [Frankliniella occidentalis]